MDIAQSISRGCFAFKGKQKAARAEDYLPIEGQSSDARHSLLQRLWGSMDKEIQSLQSDVNNKMFDDLLNFIKNCHLKTKQKSPVVEIPSAALITGVNTPDHGVMFTNLAALLRKRVTPLVAILHAKNCSSMKTLLTTLLHQLIDGTQNELMENERGSVQHHYACSMASLAKYYRTKYQKSPVKSPRKSPSKKCCYSLGSEKPEKQPVITIILEDLESFSSSVLQDFVVTCSIYLDRLPLVLVFGIATSVNTIHRLMPTSVSSLLCMEKFQAPLSSHYLNLVIDKILMTTAFPFKLGPRVFQLLLDMFLCHHLSVINFLSSFQFCLLDHFMNNSASILCCQHNLIPSRVKELTSAELDIFRQLPSMMRYMEQMPRKELADVLEKENSFRKLITSLFEKNHLVHHQSFALIRVLHLLTSHLPTHPLGKQLRELYASCLEHNIHETDGFNKAFELLGMTARDELVSLVTKCLTQIQDDAKSVELADVCDQLSVFLFRLNHLDDEMCDESAKMDEVTTENLKLQRTDLRSLQRQLQELGKQKKITPYERVRKELLDFLRHTFKKHLQKAEAMELYEVLYYDDVASVQKHLNAAPRSAIHLALSNPAYYLQCKCCHVADGGICPTMPDVCIIYKLHLECGNLINLYDWLQAFASIVNSEKQENKNKHQPDQTVQARFIQAVSELQFLGFVKPTKRKTDHVSRLTWGGY